MGYYDTVWDTDAWKHVLLFISGFHNVDMFTVVAASSWGGKKQAEDIQFTGFRSSCLRVCFLRFFACPDQDMNDKLAVIPCFNPYKFWVIYVSSICITKHKILSRKFIAKFTLAKIRKHILCASGTEHTLLPDNVASCCGQKRRFCHSSLNVF